MAAPSIALDGSSLAAMVSRRLRRSPLSGGCEVPEVVSDTHGSTARNNSNQSAGIQKNAQLWGRQLMFDEETSNCES